MYPTNFGGMWLENSVTLMKGDARPNTWFYPAGEIDKIFDPYIPGPDAMSVSEMQFLVLKDC